MVDCQDEVSVGGEVLVVGGVHDVAHSVAVGEDDDGDGGVRGDGGVGVGVGGDAGHAAGGEV